MLSQTEHLQGRQKADALVNGYAQHTGAGEAHLDENNDRSFGDFGFRYEPQRNELAVRVFIARTLRKEDVTPEMARAAQETLRALNDPNIGGLFETDGGHFTLDENKQMIFLMKELRVDPLRQDDFNRKVDDLRGLSGMWITRWFPHVADMAHGHEHPPTHRITRQNNPYPL